MHRDLTRRRVLAALGSGCGVGVAGCLAAETAPVADDGDESPASDDANQSAVSDGADPPEGFAGHEVATPVENGTLAQRGWPSTICDRAQRDVGLTPIDDPEPAPADAWPGMTIGEEFELIETGEPDADVVIGVARDGTARAYPLATLWWSEIVNDDLGGPLLVTYCPLCRSGLVADRRVRGSVTRFDVSGLLWEPPAELTPDPAQDGEGVLGGGPEEATAAAFRDDRRNLVFVDGETGSYWSQLLGRAICGPAAGERLSLVPASMTTFGEWRDRYPGTTVVLPPTTGGPQLD